MKIAESGHLTAQFEKPFLQFKVFRISRLIEYLPSLRNGGVFGNDPGVERTTDASQMAQGVNCAKSAAGNANEAYHLSFKLLKTHQVECVLQDAAQAAMILRSSQNHAVSAFDLFPQPENVLRISALVFLPIAKDQLILSEIN